MMLRRICQWLSCVLVASCSHDAGRELSSQIGNAAGGGAEVNMNTPCVGKAGALRGKSMQTLMAAGLPRSFIHYAPTTLDPNTPAPVVIVPHGFMMTADMMFEITQYSAIADRERIIVLF